LRRSIVYIRGGRVMECIRCVVTCFFMWWKKTCWVTCVQMDAPVLLILCLAVEVVFVLVVLSSDCRLGRCRIVVEWCSGIPALSSVYAVTVFFCFEGCIRCLRCRFLVWYVRGAVRTHPSLLEWGQRSGYVQNLSVLEVLLLTVSCSGGCW
jgi:hypothetical protein